jgi:DNA-binding MarR family transcriptional regulator
VEEKHNVVLDAMKKAKKPLRPGDIAGATGIDQKEVSKIIDALKKEGKVVSPKRCYWEPKG